MNVLNCHFGETRSNIRRRTLRIADQLPSRPTLTRSASLTRLTQRTDPWVINAVGVSSNPAHAVLPYGRKGYGSSANYFWLKLFKAVQLVAVYMQTCVLVHEPIAGLLPHSVYWVCVYIVNNIWQNTSVNGVWTRSSRGGCGGGGAVALLWIQQVCSLW